MYRQWHSNSLIHIIDIQGYQELIDRLQQNLNNDVGLSYFLHPLLNHELTELQAYLDRLKPKTKRFPDFLGSVWKWMARNPDHDHFEILTKKTNSLLRNNNKQVVINKLTREEINELTNITNNLLKMSEKKNFIDEQLLILLKHEWAIIKEEILNIQHVIHWAKVGVANSFVLTSNEIDIKQVINEDFVPFVNLEQAFEFAEVKVAFDHDSIVYILSIPITNVNACDKIVTIESM